MLENYHDNKRHLQMTSITVMRAATVRPLNQKFTNINTISIIFCTGAAYDPGIEQDSQGQTNRFLYSAQQNYANFHQPQQQHEHDHPFHSYLNTKSIKQNHSG